MATTQSAVTGSIAGSSPWLSRTRNQATAKPRNMLPASPMKTRARFRPGSRRLKHRKASTELASASRTPADVASPAESATRPRMVSVISVSPPASPSMPSSMFSALVTPTTESRVKGRLQAPSRVSSGPESAPRSVKRTPPHRVIISPAAI